MRLCDRPEQRNHLGGAAVFEEARCMRLGHVEQAREIRRVVVVQHHSSADRSRTAVWCRSHSMIVRAL